MLDDSEFDNVKKQDNQITIKKSTYSILLIGIVAAIAIATFFGGYAIGNLENNSNSLSTDEIIEMISEIEAKIPASVPQPAQGPTQPSTPQRVQVSLDDDPVRGDPDAPVTLVEFSDFQCPFCARFHTQTLPAIQENYIDTGKINFVYRDFPIQSIHPNAIPAALASECADDQGKFWEMHDMIFENQGNWQDLQLAQSASLFREYAIEIGLNMDEFDPCMTSGKYLEEIQNDLNDGRAYGVTGTPGFFIGNEKIGFTKIIGAQPFSSFQRVIEQQLVR